MMKRMFVLQKKSSKRSSVDVNCGSDNPAGLFPPDFRKKFAENVEVKKKQFLFLEKSFSSKRSFGHAQFNFWNTAEIPSSKV